MILGYAIIQQLLATKTLYLQVHINKIYYNSRNTYRQICTKAYVY